MSRKLVKPIPVNTVKIGSRRISAEEDSSIFSNQMFSGVRETEENLVSFGLSGASILSSGIRV